MKSQYGTILSDLAAAYDVLKPFGYARDYYLEITSKVELLTVAGWMNSLVVAFEKDGDKGYQQRLKQAKSALDGLFAEYNNKVDQQLFSTLMDMYYNNQDEKYQSPLFREKVMAAGKNFSALADNISQATQLDAIDKALALLG